MLYHIGGLKSVYNSEALSSIDFYPGGFGTRYGGAGGGAIEIQGKKAADDRLHLKLDLSTLDGYFLAEGPVNEKVSVMGSGRRCFIGEIRSWDIKNNRDKLNTCHLHTRLLILTVGDFFSGPIMDWGKKLVPEGRRERDRKSVV